MPVNKHAPFLEDIPAYSLGALDAGPASALEAHLAECASCRAELAAHRVTAEGLLLAMPPSKPSAALRRRLRASLPGSRRPSGARMGWSFGQFALGAALTVILVVSILSVIQAHTLQQQQAQLSQQLQSEQTALALLAYPGVKTIPIDANGISGTLLLDGDRNAVALFAWNLPVLPASQTYQAWLIDSQDERVSLGLFHPQAGLPFTTFSTISPRELSGFVGIGVTVEPAGGSPHPTGARLFRVDF